MENFITGDVILNPFTLHTYRVTGISEDGIVWMKRRKYTKFGVELVGPYVKFNPKVHQRATSK
jgi:hypothetical protein